MKKILWWVVALACIVAIGLCIIHRGREAPDDRYNLEINGVLVRDESVRFFQVDGKPCAAIPFVRVLSALGQAVEQRDQDAVCVTLKETAYVLSLSDKTLCKEGDDDNYLLCPPGCSTFYCRREGDELFVDSETVNATLYLLHAGVRVDVDYDTMRVKIYEVKSDGNPGAWKSGGGFHVNLHFNYVMYFCFHLLQRL